MTKSETMSPKESFEETYASLQEIIEQLERGQLSLEESFTKYKEGMEKLSLLHQQVDHVEKELAILEENGVG